MIKTSKLKSEDFSQTFSEMENRYIEELEEMLLSKLISEKSIHLSGKYDETLEFAGRTNYKIRLRVPNKNVWSISFRDFRESIRKVLRNGIITESEFVEDKTGATEKVFKQLTTLLLHVLPEEEYIERSFIGNSVIHPTLGSGKVISISDSGNVEVEFRDKIAKLKPNYIQLKTSEK
jgi:ribosomal protein L19E